MPLRRRPRSLARAGPGDASSPPAASATPPKPEAPETAKYIFENFLGFRSVHGARHDASLGRLPLGADSARIIDQIARQFGFTHAQVLELARKFRLEEVSPREDWLAVYDCLQAANRDYFKRLDSHKYQGELPSSESRAPGWGAAFARAAERFKAYLHFEGGSYRQLANRTYAPGWRGALLRLSELHKHLSAWRSASVPPFDMFVFGYFRQAIAFEFFHSTEDFLILAKDKDGKAQMDMAKKWLESAMREQAFRGSGSLQRPEGPILVPPGRSLVLTPLAKPLATFVVRRMTLAVMSAVAILLGAFAPLLPLSFALTAILSSAPRWWSHSTAARAGRGHSILRPCLGPRRLGRHLGPGQGPCSRPLLNTLILTTCSLFPPALRENRAKARHAPARR